MEAQVCGLQMPMKTLLPLSSISFHQGAPIVKSASLVAVYQELSAVLTCIQEKPIQILKRRGFIQFF
jgi:hypothetical protein